MLRDDDKLAPISPSLVSHKSTIDTRFVSSCVDTVCHCVVSAIVAVVGAVEAGKRRACRARAA